MDLKYFKSTIWKFRVYRLLKSINKFSQKYVNLSKQELISIFQDWRSKHALTESNYQDHIPKLFGLIRAFFKQSMSIYPYDIQVLAGLALCKKKFLEIKTGEGKTFIGVFPGVIWALMGRKVHIITANEYLAERDSNLLKEIYACFGLTVDFIKQSFNNTRKRKAYKCNIIHGSGAQFGFDYLYNNNCSRKEEQFMSELDACIIDETDKVLIDDSGTPLLISGPVDKKSDLYAIISPCIEQLSAKDYYVDSNSRTAYITSAGFYKITKFLIENKIIDTPASLFTTKHSHIHHIIRNLAKAHFSMKKDVEYVVFNNKEIILIDTFTDRPALGRRFSDGLHQAIEAKESVQVKADRKTIAQISFPCYINLYKHKCGMSGTVLQDQDELYDVFEVESLALPTNKPIQRIDHPIILFNYKADSIKKTVELVLEKHRKGQPVLLCASSVYDSEIISNQLTQKSVTHQVLNAKQTKEEAYIVSEAGKPGAVTVSTGMAGRGTDIMLGGNASYAIKQLKKNIENQGELNAQIKYTLEQHQKQRQQVLDVGGLCVIILGIPELEKIEMQFIGRSGRQGEPGVSYRLFSLEDRLFSTLQQDEINTSALANYFPESQKQHSGGKVNEVCHEIRNGYNEYQRESRHNSNKFESINNECMKSIYYDRQRILDNCTIDTIKEYTNYGHLKTLLGHTSLQESLKQKPNLINKIQSRFVQIIDNEWSKFLKIISQIQYIARSNILSQKEPVNIHAEKTYKAFQKLIQVVMDRFTQSTADIVLNAQNDQNDLFESILNNKTDNLFGNNDKNIFKNLQTSFNNLMKLPNSANKNSDVNSNSINSTNEESNSFADYMKDINNLLNTKDNSEITNKLTDQISNISKIIGDITKPQDNLNNLSNVITKSNEDAVIKTPKSTQIKTDKTTKTNKDKTTKTNKDKTTKTNKDKTIKTKKR